MRKLENLPAVAESSLHELTAGEELKYRILSAAASGQETEKKNRFRSVVPVVCACVAVMIVALGILNNYTGAPTETPSVSMNNYTAGYSANSRQNDDHVLFQAAGLQDKKLLSIEITGCGTISDPETCAELLSLLLNESVYLENSETESKGQETLIIRTEQGETFIFPMNDSLLYDHGTWNCESFVRSFSEHIH